jgi:hypothetical protein
LEPESDQLAVVPADAASSPIPEPQTESAEKRFVEAQASEAPGSSLIDAVWLEEAGVEIIRATRSWIQYGTVGFAVICIVIGAVEALFGR